jgi:hypothetical protein
VPETGHLKLETAKMLEAHDPLLKVFVGHHEPEAKKVRRSITQECDTSFPG